jgi:hypothetical protein
MEQKVTYLHQLIGVDVHTVGWGGPGGGGQDTGLHASLKPRKGPTSCAAVHRHSAQVDQRQDVQGF